MPGKMTTRQRLENHHEVAKVLGEASEAMHNTADAMLPSMITIGTDDDGLELQSVRLARMGDFFRTLGAAGLRILGWVSGKTGESAELLVDHFADNDEV